MADKKDTYFKWIIGGLLLAIFIAVGYKVKESYKPTLAASVAVDPACDLNKRACSSMLPDGGEVTFSIAPTPIPMLKPLTVKMSVKDIDVEKAVVDFVGISVYMGFNRVTLTPVGDETFEAEAVLPVCVDAKMTWEARVLLETPKGLVKVPFEFETER